MKIISMIFEVNKGLPLTCEKGIFNFKILNLIFE